MESVPPAYPTTSSTNESNIITSSSAGGVSVNVLVDLPDITSVRGASVRLDKPPQASSLLSGLDGIATFPPFRSMRFGTVQLMQGKYRALDG